MKSFLLCSALVLLEGCSSPPAYHYTLSPAADRAPTAALSALPTPSAAKAYVLGPVTVPSEVDSTMLVTREPSGRLLLLSDDRGAAPLSAHLQSALGLELTQALGMPPLQNITQALAQTTATLIQVDVQRFDLVPGQYVALDALWRLRFEQGAQVLTCFSRFKQNVEIGVSALVLGQQKNTQLLSAQIAQALSTRKAPSEASCTRT